MAKKIIHCKDGLTNNEEIQARRIRAKLEEGNQEEIEYVRLLYSEWYNKPKEGFLQWLCNNDKRVLSSALKRMNDWTSILL